MMHLENYFKNLKSTVSAETLLNDPYYTIILTAHNNAFDKYLGAVIGHNNKPIALFSIIMSNPQLN